MLTIYQLVQKNLCILIIGVAVVSVGQLTICLAHSPPHSTKPGKQRGTLCSGSMPLGIWETKIQTEISYLAMLGIKYKLFSELQGFRKCTCNTMMGSGLVGPEVYITQGTLIKKNIKKLGTK